MSRKKFTTFEYPSFEVARFQQRFLNVAAKFKPAIVEDLEDIYGPWSESTAEIDMTNLGLSQTFDFITLSDLHRWSIKWMSCEKGWIDNALAETFVTWRSLGLEGFHWSGADFWSHGYDLLKPPAPFVFRSWNPREPLEWYEKEWTKAFLKSQEVYLDQARNAIRTVGFHEITEPSDRKNNYRRIEWVVRRVMLGESGERIAELEERRREYEKKRASESGPKSKKEKANRRRTEISASFINRKIREIRSRYDLP